VLCYRHLHSTFFERTFHSSIRAKGPGPEVAQSPRLSDAPSVARQNQAEYTQRNERRTHSVTQRALAGPPLSRTHYAAASAIALPLSQSFRCPRSVPRLLPVRQRYAIHSICDLTPDLPTRDNIYEPRRKADSRSSYLKWCAQRCQRNCLSS
jgi:hypothetical protein